MNNLQPEARASFFRNWLALLAFVNDQYDLVKGFGHPQSAAGIPAQTIETLKNKLWKDVRIIDRYIESVWDLPKADIQILKGWKKKKAGIFLIMRHLKNYTVFMDEKETLYGVIGITNPIPEIVPPGPLPVLVQTVLLPFGDTIIYDSIFQFAAIHLGPNIRRDYNALYSETKKKKGIITSIT